MNHTFRIRPRDQKIRSELTLTTLTGPDKSTIMLFNEHVVCLAAASWQLLSRVNWIPCHRDGSAPHCACAITELALIICAPGEELSM
jgi:hypothetical protein